MTDRELDLLFKELMKEEPTYAGYRRPRLIIHNGQKGHPWEAECVRVTLGITERRLGGPKRGKWEQDFDIRVYLNNAEQAKELGLSDYLITYGQSGLAYIRFYIEGQYDHDWNKEKDTVLKTLETLLNTHGYIIDKEGQ